MMRAFPATQTLLPMGGDVIWGDGSGAPDDPPAEDGGPPGEERATFGGLLQRARADGSRPTPLMTASEGVDALRVDAAASREIANDTESKAFRMFYDLDAKPLAELLHPRENAWINPLATPLPFAPDLTVTCMYGVGQSTERAYTVVDPAQGEKTSATAPEASGSGDGVPFLIDRNVNARPKIVNGVLITDGDGTVPLMSLGYMCARGWRSRRLGYNPSGSAMRTREYRGEEATVPGMRGSHSADHVDIMGNVELIADVLTIVSGEGDGVGDQVSSDIMRIADRVDERLIPTLRGEKLHQSCVDEAKQHVSATSTSMQTTANGESFSQRLMVQ